MKAAGPAWRGGAGLCRVEELPRKSTSYPFSNRKPLKGSHMGKNGAEGSVRSREAMVTPGVFRAERAAI